MLIKAVAHAIPAYSISLFRPPKGIYNKIHSLYADFWWAYNKSKKKSHWVSWEKMCDSKFSGGLRFRDLNLFNQAFLAKQVWRLACNSGSLAARVLRSKYFSVGPIIQSTLGSRPSFV